MVGKAKAWAVVVAFAFAIGAMALAGLPVHAADAAAVLTVSDEESCLLLPAKVGWDRMKCAVLEGTLALSPQDRLAVAAGTALSVEPKARLSNLGVIEVSPGATLAALGRMENSGNLTNSGTFTNRGILANSGVISNTADAVLRNPGRLANSGTLENRADAIFINTGRIANGEGGSIDNRSYIDNRGTLMMSGNSRLANSDEAAFRNTGRMMVYCNAEVAGTVTGRAVTDKCDDPPSARLEAWSPYNPDGYDGIPGSEFTFFASAADDVRLSRLEWDFDGDGRVDATRPVEGRAAKLVNATFSYGVEGTFYPQVRAVDAAGAKSPWAKFIIAAGGKDAPLKVAASNLPPLAENMTLAAGQGRAVAIVLRATDSDGDSVAFMVVSGPSHGRLAGTAPDLTYTPDASYAGTDSFTFKATDGIQESLPATVSITVAAPLLAVQPQDEDDEEEDDLLQLLQPDELSNNPPVAYGQSVAASEDVSAQVTIAATDADGDWLEYAIVSEPQHGFLSGAAPGLTYVPDAEYSGPDSFAFVALDSFGGRSAAATVAITVAEVNDVPYAQGDSAATNYGAPVAIDVLANDWDIETEVLSITSTSSPQQGGAAAVAGGVVTYTPGAGFSGTDSFSYTVSDGSGGTATATVWVTVGAPPPAPAAQPPAAEPQPAPPAADLYCGREVSSFDKVVRGTEGSDELKGTDGGDLILGFGGDDVLRGKGGDDCLIGGPGDDRMFGDRGHDRLEGGSGDDRMWGGSEDDKMWGGSGDDKVIGDDGTDLVYGDGGDDRLWGGAGDDRAQGGDGADKLVGDSGNDLLYGDGGDDTLYDKEGDDTLDGGDGDDRGYDKEGTNQILGCERT